MDGQIGIFCIICAMAAVTYATRCAPLLVLSGRTLPAPVIRFLSHVPAAVLAALAAPALLIQENHLQLGLENLTLWAGLAALALAIKTRGFFGPVALGMAIVAVGRLF
ncbi:branched-chain amino acid transport [Solidesulfovibrio fructosivorans JJ]]|uniref:Branched-chain amino acid transport n=1 Tax=Solidesulfovibrio fructosivorans JJ] TaxID=596151 RepID=E1K1J5_SOLFR|nr:AzlD domain-containing protein [Solidesulfovibrio fructosivorans]EFL49489.1 branched-chain amino acid transport [Solidesulfovibrio fructosivorans JJ]]